MLEHLREVIWGKYMIGHWVRVPILAGNGQEGRRVSRLSWLVAVALGMLSQLSFISQLSPIFL